MGNAGRMRVERDFRLEVIWSAMADLYRDLMEEKIDPPQVRFEGKISWEKRIFDMVVATSGLVLLSPLLAVLAILIRLRLGSPVVFRQRRPGWHGKLFTCLKFRTMSDARDAQGRLLPDADRMTRFGRLLRRSSIDELPELINVIRGEMSLVGPRPLLPQYLARYTPEQMRRHEVKPGITGWAQVNGRNNLEWGQKFALDLWYVDNWSLGLDFRILARTAWQVFRCHGIAKRGHVTMPEFVGAAVKSKGGNV
jgi:lipopolysaccharide/colanic/teichoic acid biosynthesis glycosyltransferase